MDRSVLLVDAGYLLSGAGSLLLGTHRRSDFVVRIGPLLHKLVATATDASSFPLLRTYWYDGGSRQGLSAEQDSVRQTPFVKLRLGRIEAGRQKGVDSLVFRDLTVLARERAICHAFLVAGDGDMTEAVTMAQDLGVQITLVTVIPAGTTRVSQALVDEVDDEIALEAEWFEDFLCARPPVTPGR